MKCHTITIVSLPWPVEISNLINNHDAQSGAETGCGQTKACLQSIGNKRGRVDKDRNAQRQYSKILTFHR